MPSHVLLTVIAVVLGSACTEAPRPAPATVGATTAAASSSGTGRVEVRLANGRTRAFVDHGEEEENIQHLDDGRLPRVPIHVVRRQMWEAWDYVLVDLRTGDSVIVPETPEVSPDGRRLAVTAMDFEVGYGPTQVEVWRVDPNGIVLEWRETTGASYPENRGWGASEWKWLDDSTAGIVQTIPHGVDGPHEARPARITHRAGVWRLEPAGR